MLVCKDYGGSICKLFWIFTFLHIAKDYQGQYKTPEKLKTPTPLIRLKIKSIQVAYQNNPTEILRTILKNIDSVK